MDIPNTEEWVLSLIACKYAAIRQHFNRPPQPAGINPGVTALQQEIFVTTIGAFDSQFFAELQLFLVQVIVKPKPFNGIERLDLLVAVSPLMFKNTKGCVIYTIVERKLDEPRNLNKIAFKHHDI